MQRILSKRVLRDIRENLLRYLALFFLVALVVGLGFTVANLLF